MMDSLTASDAWYGLNHREHDLDKTLGILPQSQPKLLIVVTSLQSNSMYYL